MHWVENSALCSTLDCFGGKDNFSYVTHSSFHFSKVIGGPSKVRYFSRITLPSSAKAKKFMCQPSSIIFYLKNKETNALSEKSFSAVGCIQYHGG